MLYLILDLEITIIYPYTVSQYVIAEYGLIIMIIFSVLLCLGLFFEIGKNALNISSKQSTELSNLLKKFFKRFNVEFINTSNKSIINLKSSIFDFKSLIKFIQSKKSLVNKFSDSLFILYIKNIHIIRLISLLYLIIVILVSYLTIFFEYGFKFWV